MNINVLIVDDHQIMRDGLRFILEYESDMKIIGEAASGREAVTLVREKRPDLVILDIAMPDLNGIEAARSIIAEHPKTKILALSMHTDRRFVAEMLQAGAAGYLDKACDATELVTAVRRIMAGHVYLTEKVADIVVDEFKHHPEAPPVIDHPPLTTREREIIQLIAEGKSMRDIATVLNLSIKTVEKHRENMTKKLQLHGVAELTKYAIREGLTSLDL